MVVDGSLKNPDLAEQITLLSSSVNGSVDAKKDTSDGDEQDQDEDDE